MIAIATGTRADWGLLSPLACALRDSGEQVEILATNMHLDPRCGNTIEEIIADGFDPVRIPASGTPAEITADATRGFAARFRENRPDLLVILGDRFEMLGVAAAALLAGVKIVHIAGGTVSEGAFDNAIRNAISQMASLHLVETEQCGSRLERMGINPDSIKVTGALGVYNFVCGETATREELEEWLSFRISDPTLLVTLHAATLERKQPVEVMRDMLEAIGKLIAPTEKMLAEYPYINGLKVIFTYPNNDEQFEEMVAELQKFNSLHSDRTVLVRSLGRRRYLTALRCCAAVAGNSSSGLVEVPSAGIPTLDIGIRQKGREHGDSVVHCGADMESIREGLLTVLSPEMREKARTTVNPYYHDNTPGVMVKEIIAMLKKDSI